MVSPILRQSPQIKSLCLIGRSMTTINILMIHKSPFLPVFGPIFVAVLESFGDPRMSWCQVLPLTDFSLETAKPLGCFAPFPQGFIMAIKSVDSHGGWPYQIFPCLSMCLTMAYGGFLKSWGIPSRHHGFRYYRGLMTWMIWVPRKAPSCATVADMPTSPVSTCVSRIEKEQLGCREVVDVFTLHG